MIGEKTARGCYAAGTMKILALFQRMRELTNGTKPREERYRSVYTFATSFKAFETTSLQYLYFFA